MCDSLNSSAKVRTTGYVQLAENDHEAVMTALATKGPLVVGVAAGDWGEYASGIFDGCSGAKNLVINHAVQLVGYGTDANHGDYWIIRNWWGSSWGEHGYMRLKRGAKKCYDDPDPRLGFGCQGGPSHVEVCGECGILYSASYPVGAAMVA